MLCSSLLKASGEFASLFSLLRAFTNRNKQEWQVSTGAEVVTHGFSQPLAANEQCCKCDVSRTDLSKISN